MGDKGNKPNRVHGENCEAGEHLEIKEVAYIFT